MQRLGRQETLAKVLMACWGGWIGAAQAQVESLEPVVVTAARGQDTNTVVGAKRIETQQASSVRDLVQQIPEIHVSGGQSAAQKIYVRGLGERMLMVTIDGAAQPEAAYHHMGQLMVEPELLKRIEVEAGTGAATAGPGALAGAIRATTKSATDLLRAQERAGGLLKLGYHSASEAWKVSATAFGRIGEAGDLLLSVNQLDAQAYQDGRGAEVPNTASDAQQGFLKWGFNLSDDQRLEMSHEQREEEGVWNKRTNLLPAGFNPSQRQKTKRKGSTVQYLYAPNQSWIDLKAVLYANDNLAQLGLGTASEERLGTRSQGLNIENITRLGEQQRLTFGFNHRQDIGYATVATVALPDEKAKVSGVYLEDQINLHPQWQLTLGARYDMYDYTDMVGQSFDASGVSPSASVLFRPTDQWRVRATHARALRGVGIVEPFLKQHQENAPHIDAEKAQNNELNMTWESGAWQWVGTVFQQQIDNFVGYDENRANLGTVKTKGYSASVLYKQAHWRGSLGVSEAKPTLDGAPLTQDNSLLLGNSSGRTWVAQFDVDVPTWHAQFGYTARWVEELEHVPAGSAARDGYTAHDVYGRWQPTGRDDVTLTLTIKNLFDAFYYDQASFGYHPRWGANAGLPEPGRDVRVSAAWRF